MKKLYIAALILVLLLCFAACAEDGEARSIRCGIEGGSYVIRIPDASGDLGWIADDMSQDDTVVRLARAGLEGGDFVVRYDPVGDGDMCVGVRHYTGIACDETFTWDLSVKDGAVQACTGGSHAASPDPAETDPYLLGQWQTADGMAVMTVEKNPGGRAWDVDIAGAAAHGGYVFRATICYDCELDSFVYDKGKYWEVPIGDGGDAGPLGEAAIAGATGSFAFEGDGADLRLSWYDSDRPDETLLFDRAGSSAAQDGIIERLCDTWVADGFSVEIWYDEDTGAFTCEAALDDGSFCDFGDCACDAAAGALVCGDGSRFFAAYNEERVDYDYDIVDTGITAVFTVRDDTLTCEDSLGLMKGVIFLRLDDAQAQDAAPGL